MERRHVAVVTGAGQGIGAAVARRLASGGAHVFVTGRRLEPCEALAAELQAAKLRAQAVRLDVTDRDSIGGALEEILRRGAKLGPPDWLVNNAGLARSAPLLDPAAMTDTYEEHLDVNFHGARRMIEALLPAMLERGYGRIVNVASSAGLAGYPYVSAYCASKHALIGYTRAAALELEGSGVAISAVCPHFVDSPMTDRSVARIVERTGRAPEDARAALAAQNPGGRLVTPDEVAAAVAALLEGDENGALVELDGSA